MRGVGVAAAVAAAFVVAASSAAARPVRCDTSRAHVVLRTPALLVAWRNEAGARVYSSCVRRTGKTRRLGTADHGFTHDNGTEVLAHGRLHLVVQTTSSDQYGASTELRWLDAQTGRARTLYSLSARTEGATTEEHGTRYAPVLLTADGCTLLGRSPGAADATVRLVTGTFNGQPTVVDGGVIAPESVAIKGHTATWLSGGQQRTATLPTARC